MAKSKNKASRPMIQMAPAPKPEKVVEHRAVKPIMHKGKVIPVGEVIHGLTDAQVEGLIKRDALEVVVTYAD